ncbi:hypothetical protein [Nocardiopsis sp. TSRI0078]|uniref:hypothetical protein n=1 Tax=Nocardiopsis sp. TSRI0078 TaxID=1718951 RepID=UPI001160F0CE|nr:hypothetical protein [Nocardiopsis sp. TSRI0078]
MSMPGYFRTRAGNASRFRAAVDEAGDDSLGADERREVEEAMSLVYGAGEAQARNRNEVA